MLRSVALTLALSLILLPAAALARCGGGFSQFVGAMKSEARSRGHSAATVEAFFAGVRQDQKVLRADRAQGVFQLPFTEFARRLISADRLRRGGQNERKYGRIFARIEQSWGVPRGILLAFWAFETDYGAFQGNFNTRDALVTLSHDCRRPNLFRPQVFAAIQLFEQGDFDPRRTTGAWAGEIGMVQMLPEDILTNGVDGDGDGKVRLKTSAPDALMSGGKMLNHLGWRTGEPWLTEIVLPKGFDLRQSGLETQRRVSDWAAMGIRPRGARLGAGSLPASVLLPQGHKGPAFLAYPNFRVLFEWNQSFVYVMTAGYFATRLSGAPVFDAGSVTGGLSGSQMKQLQRKLQARGHNVGKVDGILGARTRAAVQHEQARLGLPADAWPTSALLGRL